MSRLTFPSALASSKGALNTARFGALVAVEAEFLAAKVPAARMLPPGSEEAQVAGNRGVESSPTRRRTASRRWPMAQRCHGSADCSGPAPETD
jgi:hypothetical protein